MIDRTRARWTVALGAGLLAATSATPALAYVGPGAGLGVLGALLAVIAAVLATVFGLILWPLRALARSRKNAKQNAAAPAPAGAGNVSDPLGGDSTRRADDASLH